MRFGVGVYGRNEWNMVDYEIAGYYEIIFVLRVWGKRYRPGVHFSQKKSRFHGDLRKL